MGKIIYFRDLEKRGRSMKINDVADYFIYMDNKNEIFNMTQLKVQKLCYYAQAWSLVWNERELFKESFEAWVHGPANRNLYKKYKSYGSNPIIKPSLEINEKQIEHNNLKILNLVWRDYASYEAKELERMTHLEDPWLITRGNLKAYEKCSEVIDNKIIENYYKQFV